MHSFQATAFTSGFLPDLPTQVDVGPGSTKLYKDAKLRIRVGFWDHLVVFPTSSYLI